MADTTTVRVTVTTKKHLDAIAAELDQSLTSAVDTIVREYRRRRWLEAVAAGYEAMRETPSDWEEEVEERMLWDRALADGLDKEG